MTGEAIAALLAAKMDLHVEPGLASQLALYLDLLVRWNAKTNLSAVREPEAMVLRHFGESLQCAAAIPADVKALLDYGSGAGFPGAVCALARPALAVTLAESQNKKAAFLQELCRSLALPARVTVHAGRVEALPGSARFDGVTLRAVDRMQAACAEARRRVVIGGWLVVMTTEEPFRELAGALPGIAWRPPTRLRGTKHGIVGVGRVLRVSELE